jgi:hypothetical protein
MHLQITRRLEHVSLQSQYVILGRSRIVFVSGLRPEILFYFESKKMEIFNYWEYFDLREKNC